MPAETGHPGQVEPPVLTAVVSEDGINEPHVEPAEGPCVLSADPAIVSLHALHVLRKNDTDKLVDELVGTLVKEIRCIWWWTARDGQVFLHKHISTRQRAQEAKTFHIFGQSRVEPIHAYKFHVVSAAKSKHLILTAHFIEIPVIIQAEMIDTACESEI